MENILGGVTMNNELRGKATYSPEDDKLRFYPDERLSPEDYAKIKGTGFGWAPKQECFYAVWTPGREDLLNEWCGGIGDEDTSLLERAEARAERFDVYSENRKRDAESAADYVESITNGIPLGQPILIGHHSQRKAEKDAQRIENGMRRAIKMWNTASYWINRANGAIANAKYKEKPAVRARRIKKLEAEEKQLKYKKAKAEAHIKAWSNPNNLELSKAIAIANCSDLPYVKFLEKDYPRAPGARVYEGDISFWSALTDGICTPQQAAERIIGIMERALPRYNRWLEHLGNRLAYERAMLQESGGIETDKTKPEKGGAICCFWADWWMEIEKVNKVSVSVRYKYSEHGQEFLNKVPFDKITKIITKAEFQEILQDPSKDPLIATREKAMERHSKAKEQKKEDPTRERVRKIKESLEGGGVQTATSPTLYPTPTEIVEMMLEHVGNLEGKRILEPSAGTGNILKGIIKKAKEEGARVEKIDLIELNQNLCKCLYGLKESIFSAAITDQEIGTAERINVKQADFLREEHRDIPGDQKYDIILMNPPFDHGCDIGHINHALEFLIAGGILVAICANGPRQQKEFKDSVEYWEELPAGTFKAAGTSVNTALLVIRTKAAVR